MFAIPIIYRLNNSFKIHIFRNITREIRLIVIHKKKGTVLIVYCRDNLGASIRIV